MLRAYGVLEEIKELVQHAERATIDDYAEGEVEQEAEMLERLITRIAEYINEHNGPHIRWSAKTLTARGTNSQESRYMVDFIGVLHVDLPQYKVDKGFLVQAKRVSPSGDMSRQDFRRMQDQCRVMLKMSQHSYVFLMNEHMIKVASAAAVVASSASAIQAMPWEHLDTFYERHFECFVGDTSINQNGRKAIEQLEELLTSYNAREALLIEATGERPLQIVTEPAPLPDSGSPPNQPGSGRAPRSINL